MELVRAIMLNVIVLVFFTTILDLLLPDGTFRSYIKMAMGLFTMLTLLQPMIQLAQPDQMTAVEQKLTQSEDTIRIELVQQSNRMTQKREQLRSTMQFYWEAAQQAQMQSESLNEEERT